MAKAKKMLSLALAVLVTVGSMGLAPASAATKKVDYYQIALTNINKYLKPQLTITKQSQSEEDLKLLQSYYRSLKIHMSRITNVKQKAAISKQLMELSQEIVAVTAQVKAQIAAADAVEAFELAALETAEDIAKAEELYSAAYDKVQDIADRTVRVALINRLNDKKTKLDAAKKALADKEAADKAAAEALKAAEDAVAAYEAAKLTTLDEVKAAKELEAKATELVAKVADAEKKAALEKRITDQKAKVDAAEVALTPLKVESVSAINAKEIKIVFNKEVLKESAENVNNYTATLPAGVTLGTPELQDDNKTVLIPLSAPLANGNSYKVSVSGVMELNYAKMEDYKDTYKVFLDKTAPKVVKAAKSGSAVKIYFDEPVTNTMQVKIDDYTVAASGTVTVSPYTGVYYVVTPPLADTFLSVGTHNVVVYNAADPVGNVEPIQTATYTVAADTTAPSVVSVKPYDGTTFAVKFSETISGLANTNFVVKKGNYTFAASDVSLLGLDPDDPTATTYLVRVASSDQNNPLYATGETSVTLNISVKNYKDAANLYGSQYDGVVTLTKDTTPPTIVSNLLNVGNGSTLTIKFNETISAVDETKITVVKDGVYMTVSSATVNSSDNKKVDVVLSSALTDGTYTVYFAPGAVKDSALNENNALTTTVAYENVTGTPFQPSSITVSNNEITINYGKAMTNSAIDIANYTLDGAALPAGSTIGFTSTAKTTVKITIPAGSIAVSGNKLLAISSNVKAEDGTVVMTSAYAKYTSVVTGFTDNIKPLLSSAKFLVTDINATTTRRILLTFNENLATFTDNAATIADFEVKVGSAVVAISNVLDETSGDNKVVLYLATPINIAQGATVKVVPVGATNAAVNITDVAGNTLTTGTEVSITDKVIDTQQISDANVVALDKAALAITFAGIETANTVKNNLTLPTTGSNGSTITWSSSNTSVVTNAGVVTRPIYSAGDATVTLTATITKGTASDTKTFTVIVLKKDFTVSAATTPDNTFTVTGDGYTNSDFAVANVDMDADTTDTQDSITINGVTFTVTYAAGTYTVVATGTWSGDQAVVKPIIITKDGKTVTLYLHVSADGSTFVVKNTNN